MKGLSLWQPWASLMAVGAKLNETRSRMTRHRGELVICASLKDTEWLHHDIMADIHIQRALFPRYNHGHKRVYFESLPLGKAVCVVDVIDCKEIGPGDGYMPPENSTNPEIYFGNYEEGRYAWITNPEKRVMLIHPVKVTGRQFLFDLNHDEELAVRTQIDLIRLHSI